LSEENTLGPYRLLRKLGEGGMGTVYLGHDDALDRRVAIKVLRFSDKGDEQFQSTQAKRFLREAKSAAKINHAHVVTIYAVGQHAGRPYLVMEHVEGGSLADHLRKAGPMGWRAATAAVRDALLALVAAHGKGVIHRDIKPANLMRGRDMAGRELIKLVDFGLARVVAGPGGTEANDGELTFPGAFVGSPSYAAPEQIAGAVVLDGRADLYSLAATWFALLTGQPPFVDDDPAETMHRHLHEEFPDTGTLMSGIPAALQEAMTLASKKRPQDRYAGAAEMLKAVEALLALPADVASEAVIRRTTHAAQSDGSSISAEESVAELESRLATARAKRDSSTQLQTLCSLYGLYSRLDRREQATKVYREALVLHIKMNTPYPN
jgi:serine/threonine-protein kinase